MSREIDARVAKEVMGHDVHNSGETPAFCEDREFAFDYIAIGPEGEKKLYALPEYSTDMNAAMEVVGKMTGTVQRWFKIYRKPNNAINPWVASFSHSHEGTYKAASDTPALAICLAALEAIKSTG